MRRSTMPWLTAVLTAALASGCASTHGLAPASTPRDPDMLATTQSFAGALSPAAWPRQEWWTQWGDPQLDALIAEALAGTPTLDAADARARKARALAGLADEARKPALGASARYSGAYLPESLLPSPIGGEYNGVTLATLDVQYAPDLWGGKRAHWESALGTLHAAEVDAQQARLTLAANIVHAYVALAQAHEAKTVAREESVRAERLLDLARQRVRAGLDNDLQVRQAESALASAGQQGQAAQQQIDALRNALSALLGKGPDRGLALDPPTLLATDAPALPCALPSELLGHRPDVVAARWRVEAASRGIDAAKAEFYPSINLTAMVGIASGNVSDLFTRDALLATAGPAISLPLFHGERLRQQLASSDADYDLAVAQYDQSVVGAVREVADALQAAHTLDAQIASATRARDATRKALALADDRYRAGLGTQLDVLGAQRPLLQLDTQLAALRAQRRNVAVDLAVALGGGAAPSSPAAFSTVAP